MSKILPNIKDRILQFAKNKEGNKQSFFKKVKLNYGNFTGKSKESDLGSKALAEILTIYPDADLHWLITGKRKSVTKITVKEEKKISYKKKYYDKLEQSDMLKSELIAVQKEVIALQKVKLVDNIRS